MPDPALLLTALSRSATKIAQLNKTLKDADVKYAIAELQNTLADAITTVASLKTENAELRASLEKVAEAEAVGEELVARGDAYYRKNPLPGKPKGPFCMNCFDAKKEIVKITQQAAHLQVLGTHRCPQCTSKVTLK